MIKPAHAVVALGLVAMATGAFSLHAVSGGSSEVVDEAAETLATTDADSGWDDLDQSIQRVLSDVGLAERYLEGGLEEIPDEVVRVLSALGVPLVVTGESG